MKNVLSKRNFVTIKNGQKFKSGICRTTRTLLIMVTRTRPKIWTGPNKLRGPDLSVRIFLVRSVVRIFVPVFHQSGPWSGFFFQNENFRLKNYGPVRILVRIFTIKNQLGPNRTKLLPEPSRIRIELDSIRITQGTKMENTDKKWTKCNA